jgi:acyl-coenzyme A thioesterase PaaI-like protein
VKDATYAVRGEVTRMTKQVGFAIATVSDGDGNIVSRSTGRFLIHREES